MRRCIVSLMTLAVAVLGTACSPEEKAASTAAPAKQVAPVPDVPVDLTTPDKALKSYWAVKDEVRRRNQMIWQERVPAFREAERRLADVLTATMLAGQQTTFEDPEQFSRDILEVKVESDSRAVVVTVIKNTTPLPSGASPSRFDEERRRDGERYKYVLEKAANGWQVAEVWEWDTYPSPGWKKVAPGDGTPRVASLTYEGR